MTGEETAGDRTDGGRTRHATTASAPPPDETEKFRVHTTDSPDDGVRVFGTPLHASAERLADEYRSRDLTDFLAAEARRSCGSYVLADFAEEGVRLVTSPGYPGGYVAPLGDSTVVATVLSRVLESVPRERLSFDADALERYYERVELQLPFTSVFESIHRLPPASYIDVDGGSIAEFRHFAGYADERPANLASAFGAIARRVADEDVLLLFSGGVDSTAYYLALDRHRGDGALDLAAVDIGPNANNVPRARRVADAAGATLDVFDYRWPPDSAATLDRLQRNLERDFVNPFAPSNGLAVGDRYDLVLNGQNTDAVATVDMKRPQLSPGAYLYATRDVGGFAFKVAKNAQFTDPYIESETLRRLYARLALSVRDTDFEADPSAIGYLVGAVSCMRPTFVAPGDDETATEEVGTLLARTRDSNLRTAIDVLNFYYYSHNMSKELTTFPVAAGTRMSLPANWGPLVSYFVGKRRTVRDAVSPKREIYEYVEDRLGRTYQDAAFDSVADRKREMAAESEYKAELPLPLLARYADRLDPDRSLAVSLASDEVAADLRTRYDSALARVGDTATYHEARKLHRIVNLEAILSNVYG